MVQQYHSHLYKEYVLADLTTRPGQVGLQWRTRAEVESGRGHTTCGNKFCRCTSCSPENSSKTDLLLRNYFSSAISNSEFEERKLLERKYSKISPGGREVVVNYLWPDAMMKPMILHETYTVNETMLQYYPKDHVKMTALAVRSFVSPIRQTFDYRYDSSSSIKPQNYFHQSSYQYYQGGVNLPPPKK